MVFRRVMVWWGGLQERINQTAAMTRKIIQQGGIATRLKKIMILCPDLQREISLCWSLYIAVSNQQLNSQRGNQNHYSKSGINSVLFSDLSAASSTDRNNRDEFNALLKD